MSSYPYDLRLLDHAPDPTETKKQAIRLQEGRNANQFASDDNDGRETSGHHRWTYRRKIIMLIGIILVIGAIVGGAVGGTLASKNTESNSPSGGTGPSTVFIPVSATSSGAPAQSITGSLPPPSTTLPPA